MRISQSEISQFLQCRRKWDLTSQVRRSLARVGPPNENLHVGTLVHAGLEIHMRQTPQDDFWSAWEEEVNALNAPIYEAFANAPKIGEAELDLDPMVNQARRTLQRYFHQYGYIYTYGQDKMLIGVEFPFNVSVPGVLDTQFQGTFDGLMYDKAKDKIVIIEHKTFARKPDLELERMKPQFVAYAWAAKKLFHRDVEVMYNGLHKKTGNACVRAIFTFDDAELDAFTETLKQVSVEMYEASSKGRLYPNRHWMECKSCGVREICDEMQRGRDPKPLIASKYRKTEPRSTYSDANASSTDTVDVLMKLLRQQS